MGAGLAGGCSCTSSSGVGVCGVGGVCCGSASDAGFGGSVILHEFYSVCCLLRWARFSKDDGKSTQVKLSTSLNILSKKTVDKF